MDVSVLAVVGAFLLFVVLLPLFGLLFGFLCYYVLPYLFGGIVLLCLLLGAGVKIPLSPWFWLATLAWASAVFFIRMKFRALGEEIEHHRAAHAAILCGLPYLRRRNELRETVPEAAES